MIFNSRKFLILLPLLFLCVLPSFAQSKVWTLEECINYALQNNISIKQSEIDIKGTDIEKTQAIGNFLPRVNVGASYNWNQGSNINPVTNRFENQYFQSASGGVSASLDIFGGLQNWRKLQRAKLSRIASQYNLDKMKDDIALAVINAYLDVLSGKEQLKVLNAQRIITNQNIQRTQELIDAGALPKGDIFELEAQKAQQQQQIINAQNTLFIAKMGLAQLLLLEDYQNFEIADTDLEVPLTDILSQSPYEIIKKAREVRNEIKIAEANVALAKNSVLLAKSAILPRVSASFGYNTRWSKSITQFDFLDQLNNNKGLSAGIGLNIPILNGFSTRNNVQQQKLNLEKSQWALRQTELNLERNVYQAYNDALNSEKLFNATQKSSQAKKQAYEYAKERYNVGLLDAFSFNQVKSQYENAETEAVRAKYNYIFKLKVLQYYFGIPVFEKP